MNTPSRRVLAVAKRILPQDRKQIFNRDFVCQSTPSWICKQCGNCTFPLTILKRTANLLGKPVALPAGPHAIRLRALSSSSRLQDSTDFRDDLPSKEEGRRSHASKRFDHLMDNLQSNIFTAGQRLNDLTGYTGIEALKKEIEQQEILVRETRSSLQRARDAYTKAVSQRSASQREVNELLQRKHAWNSADLERFTELYRSDHANEQAESAAQHELAETEKSAEEAASQLSKSILARYHEEQIWSDKIRRMSTWGTWGLMGVNVLLFLVFQIGVEPWRRKRLVKGFEDKVMEALEREGSQDERVLMGWQTARGVAAEETTVRDTVADQAQNVSADTSMADPSLEDPGEILAVGVPPAYATDLAAPMPRRLDLMIGGVRDLFSDRRIPVRRIDVTITALEGAAAGMAVAGLFLLLLRPR